LQQNCFIPHVCINIYHACHTHTYTHNIRTYIQIYLQGIREDFDARCEVAMSHVPHTHTHTYTVNTYVHTCIDTFTYMHTFKILVRASILFAKQLHCRIHHWQKFSKVSPAVLLHSKFSSKLTFGKFYLSEVPAKRCRGLDSPVYVCGERGVWGWSEEVMTSFCHSCKCYTHGCIHSSVHLRVRDSV